MMSGGMDSMMGGVMGFGWLPVLVAVALVIGGVVLLVKLLTPAAGPAAGGIANIVLAVLAVIGGVALVAVLAMGTMHLGMRCCG
jgi:hypothetical protein